MLVATYNIQFGKGRDGQIDLDRIARAVECADLIAMQEVERNWRKGPYSDQVDRLGEVFKDRYAIFTPTLDIDASAKNAQGRIVNARRQYGLLVLSRWPILCVRSLPLPKYPISGHINDPAQLQEAVIAHPAAPFRLYNTHLNSVSRRQRLLQIERILAFIADAPRQGGPIVGLDVPATEFTADWMTLSIDEAPPMPEPAILLGDFNMQTNSPEYDCLVGPRDPIFGRLSEGTLFTDALTASGIEESDGVTRPSPDGMGGKRIDHILVSKELVHRIRRAWIDNEAVGSDHQPVFAEIDWV